MNNEPQIQLAQFSEEEGKEVEKDIQDTINKHSGHFVVTPIINSNGTIGAKLEVFKKVELVPKDSVASPSEFLPADK